MIDALPEAVDGFTFIDLGSGKGRTLLMAASYPFRRIIGMELLGELNAVAARNIAGYRGDAQQCFAIESHTGDARYFPFPAEPTVLYLFNPFPRHIWREVLSHLDASLHAAPRKVYVIYHNPVHEDIPGSHRWLHELRRTHQWVIYEAAPENQPLVSGA